MSSQEPRRSVGLSVLGGFRIRVGDATLPPESIEGRKPRTLLKLLALQPGHLVVRDRAIDHLWPDLDAAGGSAQLYKAVHHLRKAFGSAAAHPGAESWIESTDEVVRLAPPDGTVTDTGLFERAARRGLETRRSADLEHAAGLYAGDLLPGDLYVEWTESARDYYRHLYLDVMLALADAQQVAGDRGSAAETCRLLLHADPLHESAHRGLMRLLAEQGQRSRAIRQYHVLREALSRELGVEPSRETEDLVRAIEEQRLAESAPAASRKVSSAAAPAPMVGRTRERASIEIALAEAAAGRGRVLVVSGPMGIGKTRLVEEAVSLARSRSWSTLTGRAHELEAAVAYGPFVDILQEALRESRDGVELIPAEVAASIPGFVGAPESVPNSDRRAAQGYLFARILQFLSRRAESAPLLVAVEDLHAADEGTIELFHYIARRIDPHRMVLLGTHRTDLGPVSDRIADRLAASAGTPDGRLLALEALDEAQHRELVEQHAGSARLTGADVEAIHELSEGNPLFALVLAEERSRRAPAQLARPDGWPVPAPDGAPGGIPDRMRRSLQDRMGIVSEPAQRLLGLAAVVGREVDYRVLEDLWGDAVDAPGGGRDGEGGPTGQPRADLLDSLEELTGQGLLDELGMGYRFRHAMMRAAIYDSLSGPRRRALHGSVARCLARADAGSERGPVEQIAFHYRLAGDKRQAAHFLMLAGDRAEAVYAHEDAIRRYQEAIDLLEPADNSVMRRLSGALHDRMGDVYRASGHLGRSFEAYERALSAIADLPVNQVDRTELHRKIALSAIYASDMDRAGVHLAEAWRTVGPEPRRQAQLHVARALYLWHFNRLEEAAEYALRALALAEPMGADVEIAQACEILAMTYLPMGRWEDGLVYEMRRLRQGRWSPDVVVATDAHLCLWEYHVRDEGMLDGATRFIRQVAREAGRLGDLRCEAVCHYAMGTIHLWQGDVTPAAERLADSLALHNRVGSPAGIAYTLARRGVLLTVGGAIDQAWEAVQEGIAAAGQASIREHCLQRLYGIGLWNRMEAGDTDQVERLVALSEALLEEYGPCTACSLDLYPWLAWHYLERGEPERASACGEALATLASRTGNPVGAAFAASVRAGVKHAAGGTAESVAGCHEEAARLLRGIVEKGSASPVMRFFDLVVDRTAGPHRTEKSHTSA
jgi:DNA-binding SARP family transcriptional activator/tetratricopeptide (TPR) repeat protein